MSKKFPVCRLDLGFTRVAGYCLYCQHSHEFQETTPKEVKDLIKKGQVIGLKLNKDGDIELDTEGFNMENLMVKSAVGRYRTLYPSPSIVNCMYAVVRVIETDNGRLYETVSNRCARVNVSTEKLKVLMQVGNVAGVKMGADGEIEICKGVTIEDKRTKTEQFNTFQTGAMETEQSLGGVNIEAEKASTATVKGAEKVVEKSVESVAIESIITVEQDDSGLEVGFNSIDVPEVHDGVNTISCDTPINFDNAEENEDDSPSKEPVKEKRTTSPRKTKKK